MLFHPSGGLTYHFRALRYRRRLWLPFCRDLGAWLGEWKPGRDQLVIIAPNAGYTLNPEFLAQFRSIVCVDPDPLASVLFRARYRNALRGVKLSWSFRDFFVQTASAGPSSYSVAGSFAGWNMSTARLLREAYPEACFLFSNFLGQMKFFDRSPGAKERLLAWQEQFAADLQGVPWLSYHDLRSGESEQELREGGGSCHWTYQLWAGGTDQLWAGGSAQEFYWHILPDYWHRIRALRSVS